MYDKENEYQLIHIHTHPYNYKENVITTTIKYCNRWNSLSEDVVNADTVNFLVIIRMSMEHKVQGSVV
jgi:hypothetical protein